MRNLVFVTDNPGKPYNNASVCYIANQIESSIWDICHKTAANLETKVRLVEIEGRQPYVRWPDKGIITGIYEFDELGALVFNIPFSEGKTPSGKNRQFVTLNVKILVSKKLEEIIVKELHATADYFGMEYKTDETFKGFIR